MNKRKRNDFFILALGWMLAGWIIRLLYLLLFQAPVRDAYKYKEQIEIWKSTGILPEIKGYPPFALFFFKTINDFFHGEIIKDGTIANLAIGLMIIYLAVKYTAQYTNNIKIAFVVGGIAATHPALVHYSCQMLRENMFILMVLLGLSFLKKYLDTGEIIAIMPMSFCLAIGFLCRNETLEIIVSFCIIMLFRKMCLKDKAKAIGFMMIIFLVSAIFVSIKIGIPIHYYLGSYRRILDKINIFS